MICLTLHKPATHMLFVPALQGVESFTIFWSITKLFSSLRQYSIHGSRFFDIWAVQLCSLLSDNGILSLYDAHCIIRYEGLFGSQGCGGGDNWSLSRWIENRQGKESAKSYRVSQNSKSYYYWIILGKIKKIIVLLHYL